MALTGIAKKRWVLADCDRAKVAALARDLKMSETLATLLIKRGFDQTEPAMKFLKPSIKDLHDPFLMKDMRQAVGRILSAVAKQEKILIYGDYDVDGTTAVVILKSVLGMIGAKVGYYIPQRLVDGYGMKETAIERAKDDGYHLIISVDCGIRAHRVVDLATQLGLDVIITDHHLPEEGLPKAVAVLNPKRTDCPYPEKNLAGVGVAFKLVQALLKATRLPNYERIVESFTKIVAIGTIADIVPLVGENRIIASYGLAGLCKPNNPGLQALLETAGVSGRPVSCYDIAFRVAPRINAVGRMGGASAAVELFSARTLEEARAIALEMNQQNSERQKVEADIIEEIMDMIKREPHLTAGKVAVLARRGWHRGVIGIAASKIVEKIHRPTIIISLEEDGYGYGSGRSIKAFHLLKGLTSCQDLFERFGGHSHAAGLTIKEENIPALRQRLNAYADTVLKKGDLLPELEIDCMQPLSSINLDLVHEIAQMEPFGEGNPTPVFACRDAIIVGEPRIVKEKHLKFKLMHNGRVLDSIWWSGAAYMEELFPGDRVRLAFTMGENTYNGITQVQLTVKDMIVG